MRFKEHSKIGAVLIIAFLVVVSGCIQIPTPKPGTTSTPDGSLKKFSSYDELSTFLKDRTISRVYGYGDLMETFVAKGSDSAAPSAETSGEAGGTPDFSTTNIQVEGVDEADIIKTDGNYIYAVTGSKLVIVKAFPAHEAKILSTLEFDGTVYELFINKDRLTVFTVEDSYEYIIPEGVEVVEGADLSIFPRTYETLTHVKVFDVTDRADPKLVKDEKLDGNYFNSRMIGDYVYVLSTNWIYSYYGAEEDIDVPGYSKCIGASKGGCGDFPDIYYIDVPGYSYMFTTVAAVNTQTDEELSKKVYLMPSTDDMFVSQNNIYITYVKYDEEYVTEKVGSDVLGLIVPTTRTVEKTAIHRIAINGKDITLEASGEVLGTHLNQFSMDEYNGYFRIATTTGNLWDKTSANHLFVLDKDLNTVGKLENLAPGESIYSARFMGNRAYVVTFKKVDPLFVIDLKDPTNPQVLGKLKIPGFSDYLHPYDENHIIGIGKETVEAEEGDFAWYQGVKLALFDVTDPSKPKEISKVEIGDRGTDSYALTDHRAFLFDKEKKLLVIPILLAEIDKSQYPEGVQGSTYGDYTFQGAYVYSLDLENGFQFNGGVTHVENKEDLLKSGYYYWSPYDVKRSLYIGDVLYTLSDKSILANDLRDLSQIKRVDLPYEEPDYYYGPIIE